MVVRWRRDVLVDGDDCGMLCVLKKVLGVQLSIGAWVLIVVGVVGKIHVGMVATR